MNETSTFRRVAATLTIGSFSVAALMGILALLGAGSFGDQEAKVLLTTLVVGSASVCVLCYLSTAGTRWAPVGAIGGVVALLPTVTALVLIWSDWSAGRFGHVVKPFGIGLDLSLTLAQVCLLLALVGSRRGLGLLLACTVATAGVNAFLVCGLIAGTIDGGIWQLLGIVAILDVLGTLVTIALAKFSGHERPRTDPHDGQIRVTVSGDQAAALEQLARHTGRNPEQLVREAVDRFLYVPAQP